MFWDERGGGLTRQRVGPFVDTATVATVMSTNRVDSVGFSSLCSAFRRTQTIADPTWLLCIRLALLLDSLLALVIHAQRKTRGWCFTSGPMACEDFSCYCSFWDERRGGPTGQPKDPLADTATTTTVMSTNRVDLRRLSSRCCAFRRTHTSADPIRLLLSD